MLLNKFFSYILISGLLFFMVSCNGNKHQEKTQVKSYKSWKTDFVYEDFKAEGDRSISYAVYLPRSYDIKKSNRILFMFDAHARGSLPIEKYQSLAEKYHIIIAASNNSKNGQSATERNYIITTFMSDVEKQFHIDNTKIYTAGFSGGARVATLIALFNSNVAGVIGCAAGFPQVQNPVNKSFTWIGIAGNRDFNFLELKNMNRQLDANGWKSHLLVFDGKHEWPPKEVMDEAFQIVLNDKSKNLTYDYKGNSSDKALENQEIQQQKMLARAMEEKSSTWWNNEITQLENDTSTTVTINKRLMNHRLLNYLSMITYIYTDRALKLNNIESVSKYLSIYERVDPNNPDMFFFKAVRFAMLKQDKQAIAALKTAIDKGFDDFPKLNSEHAFDPLRSDSDFPRIK